MRIQRFALCICLLRVFLSVAAAQDRPPAPPDEYHLYREIVFLNVPFEINNTSEWRVADGDLQVSEIGKKDWHSESRSLLPRTVSGTWQPLSILGAPAIGSGTVTFKIAIRDKHPVVYAAMVNERAYQVGQRMVKQASGDISPEIGIFVSSIETTDRAERVATFVVDSSPFHFRIAKVAAIETDLLALVFASRHPFVNRLLLFDTKQSRVIGQSTFSEIRYGAAEHSLWLVPPQPNTEDRKEVVHSMEESTKPFSIFTAGAVSPELSTLEGIETPK